MIHSIFLLQNPKRDQDKQLESFVFLVSSICYKVQCVVPFYFEVFLLADRFGSILHLRH